ncbi:MAG: PAS domain S-box protein [Pseudodesulfovibrio sp.]|nr:PAS domain S-box protein [Pseudodesulfovibrio sp.]
MSDLVGKHYDELVCPDGNGGDFHGFAALIGEGGSDKFFESSYRTRDGSLVWGLVIVSSLASPGEGQPFYLMMVDDITKQRSVHENRDWNLKLNRALARLHEPLVNSEASIMAVAEIIYEETRNITECQYGYVGSVNPVTGDFVVHSFSKMFGTECKVDPEGMNVVFPHDGDGHYPSLWGHSLNTGVAFYANDSMHHESSKGTPKGHVDLNNYLSIPLFLKDDLVGQIGLANKDGGFSARDLEAVREFGKLFVLAISRIRDKEKIEESEARFRDLVELMQEGILADDVDGRVTYVNHRFCNMLGVSRDDLMGNPIKSFVLKDDQGWYQQQRELRKEGLLDNYELAFLHKDGHKIFTLVSPTPLFNERKEYLGSFGVVMDITKLKGLESQLLQAQKLESIGQLAAGIAHEINTPAQYVDNNIRFLKTSMEAMLGIVERCAEFVEALKTGTSREDLLYMADMVMDVDELVLLKEDIPEAVADSLVGLDRILEIVKSVKQLAHRGMKGKVFADINEAVRSTVTV